MYKNHTPEKFRCLWRPKICWQRQHVLSTAPSPHIQHCFCDTPMYLMELQEAAVISARTKWDFQHFLNYRRAAVAIHLIQLQFLRSNSIKVAGVGGGVSAHQNMQCNLLKHNRQWRPHQESKQFQNSHFRSRCPLRAQSVSFEVNLWVVLKTLVLWVWLRTRRRAKGVSLLSQLYSFPKVIRCSLQEK